mgnify:CR=1 FL=1
MSITLGVSNWQDFAADGGYYPDDLPQDWKLSYFANEFSSACLNLSAETMDIDWLQQQVDGLSEDFELSLAFSGLPQLDQWLNHLPQLSIKLHTLILPPTAFEQLLRDESRLSRLRASGIAPARQLMAHNRLWSPDKPSAQCRIALFPAQDDMKQYRVWIERWVGNRPELCETLWLQGETANYSQLTKLRTLLELLGY